VRDPESGEHAPTGLEALLRERAIRRVVIAGLATDYCVKETALDGVRLGFDVLVLADGIRAVDLQAADGKRALEAMVSAGVRVEGSGP
jgi:nicotinamidase/pyrazinamidase